MELQELRKEIDAIDSQMVELFLRRMALSAQIGEYKKAQGLPIFVPGREEEKLCAVASQAGPLGQYTQALYRTVMELSRDYQSKLR